MHCAPAFRSQRGGQGRWASGEVVTKDATAPKTKLGARRLKRKRHYLSIVCFHSRFFGGSVRPGSCHSSVRCSRAVRAPRHANNPTVAILRRLEATCSDESSFPGDAASCPEHRSLWSPERGSRSASKPDDRSDSPAAAVGEVRCCFHELGHAPAFVLVDSDLLLLLPLQIDPKRCKHVVLFSAICFKVAGAFWSRGDVSISSSRCQQELSAVTPSKLPACFRQARQLLRHSLSCSIRRVRSPK